MQNCVFAWVALIAVCVLMVLLIAMQFTSEVNWTISDFITMAIVLFASGSLFVIAARKIQSKRRRIALGIIVCLALLYIWAELAVGIFTGIGN